MSVTDDLYREIILDHFRQQRNRGKLPAPALEIQGVNPLCGDEVTLYLEEKSGQITDVKIQTRGCSISQASASMLTEVIKGKKIEEIEKAAAVFKDMMLKNGTPSNEEILGDLISLEGVKKYPVRIKCALLAWNTLLEGLKAIKEKKPAKPVVME